MPRPFFPHTLADITRNVDGALGIVVGDLADGSIWVLKRNRKSGGYDLTHYDSPKRAQTLGKHSFDERKAAINAMADAIGLAEHLS